MMMFLGECTQKNHFAPQKQTKQGKKAKLLSLLFSLFPFLSSFLFSLFSRFLTTKNFFPFWELLSFSF
jgi:hypothetical protein